jgi:integrase/recombinase XerC
MTLRRAIDEYIADMRAQGRINSDTTERAYRSILMRHADDANNRDPRTTGRNDVKRTLARWPQPNTQRKSRAVLVSFYDWAMEEGHRKDNPARQTRRPKNRPAIVYRLTLTEAAAMLDACRTPRERRAITLGICAGLRNAELRGLQGIHFQRPGFVWVSANIAKGGRERWVPIIDELEPVAAEISENVAPDEYVLPAVRWRNPPMNTLPEEKRTRPSSSQALRTLVMQVAKRAGIQAHVHPHLLRHAFGDHVARYAGIKNAQALLGHVTVGTTETYVGKPTLDELSAAVSGFGFAAANRTPTASQAQTPVPPSRQRAETPDKATTGIEPVGAASRPTEPFSSEVERLLAPLAASVALYREAFA